MFGRGVAGVVVGACNYAIHPTDSNSEGSSFPMESDHFSSGESWDYGYGPTTLNKSIQLGILSQLNAFSFSLLLLEISKTTIYIVRFLSRR